METRVQVGKQKTTVIRRDANQKEGEAKNEE